MGRVLPAGGLVATATMGKTPPSCTKRRLPKGPAPWAGAGGRAGIAGMCRVRRGWEGPPPGNPPAGSGATSLQEARPDPQWPVPPVPTSVVLTSLSGSLPWPLHPTDAELCKGQRTQLSTLASQASVSSASHEALAFQGQ